METGFCGSEALEAGSGDKIRADRDKEIKTNNRGMTRRLSWVCRSLGLR